MPKDDLVYIGHMLDTARQALGKVEDKDRAAFMEDENLRLAVTHLLQIIGEAASKVAQDYREQHPEIPWLKIVGLRYRVVHDYLNVDEEIVWNTTINRLPKLIEMLERVIPNDS